MKRCESGTPFPISWLIGRENSTLNSVEPRRKWPLPCMAVAKQAYEQKLREIEALRDDPNTAEAALPKRLSDRNGYLVSKAAAVAGDLGLQSLIPNLLKAFDRFVGPDAAKKDPKCWAKLAVIKALKDLGYRDAEPYLRGVAHIQLGTGLGRSTGLRRVSSRGFGVGARRLLHRQPKPDASPGGPAGRSGGSGSG